jgi:hypothetical protein
MGELTAINKKLRSMEPFQKLVITAFLIGAAWTRFEYKSEQDYKEIKTILEKHIITEDKTREMLEYKYGQLAQKVNDNCASIKLINEFVRPEDIVPQSARTYRPR